MGGLRLWREALAVVSTVLVVHLLVTWPVWSAPASLLFGWPGDNLLFAWNLDHVADGGTVGTTASLFHPNGFPFLFHTHTWLYGWMYRIVRPVIAWWAGGDELEQATLATNLLQAWSSAISALALAWMCRAAGCGRFAIVLLMVVLVTFSPLRLFSLYGHLNIQGTEFFLCSMACIATAMQTDGRRWWVAGGIFAGIAWLNDQTMGMFSLLFATMAGSVALWRVRLRAVPKLSFFGLSFALIAGAHLFMLARVYTSAGYYVASAHTLRLNDSLNLFLPSDYNILPMGLHELRARLGIENGSGASFLPPALVLGGLTGLVLMAKRRGREPFVEGAALWVLTLALGLVCILGEWLVVAGHRLFPIPYRVFRMIPVLENLRIPDRFVLFALVPMMIFTARTLETLSARRAGFAMAAIILVSLPTSRLVPVVTDVSEGPFHLTEPTLERIRSRGGAVWALGGPAFPKANAWQIQHGQPEIFGLIARVPPSLIEDRFSRYPFLPWVLNGVGPDPVAEASVEDFVRDSGLRTVLHDSEAQPLLERMYRVKSKEAWGALGVEFIPVDAAPLP